jgi:cytochrome c553
MRYVLYTGIMALLSAIVLQPALADITAGEQLHQQNCVACHAQGFAEQGSAIYTRADRRIHSLAALHSQVNFCQNNLGLGWFEEEVQSVTDYLNQQYYDVD